ncbi:MAG: hypothetical protein JSS02_10165, partial [Planctomycetes bacterium]|nr:hypothetical protein [Planctomycetota bacterium]
AGYDGEKNYVRLWDFEKEGDQPAKTFSHKSRVHHIAFSADGEKFVSACEDGTVWIWDINNDQQELTHWAAHDDGAALCAEFSNDGNWVISGGQNDKLAKVWKIENQQAQLWNKCEGHAGPVNSVAFSPISNPEDLVHTRVITGSNDTFVKVWDPRLNQPNNKSNAQELLTLKGHDRAVTVVAFSPDGSTVLSAGRDGRIMLRPSRK